RRVRTARRQVVDVTADRGSGTVDDQRPALVYTSTRRRAHRHVEVVKRSADRDDLLDEAFVTDLRTGTDADQAAASRTVVAGRELASRASGQEARPRCAGRARRAGLAPGGRVLARTAARRGFDEPELAVVLLVAGVKYPARVRDARDGEPDAD